MDSALETLWTLFYSYALYSPPTIGLITAPILRCLWVIFCMLIALQALNWFVGGKIKKDGLGTRLATWWLILAPLVLGFALGFWGILILNFALSCRSLLEFFRAVPLRDSDSGLFAWLIIAAICQYFWVALPWLPMAMIFIPIYFLLIYPIRMLISGNPQHFLIHMGSVHWASMSFIYGLSHFSLLLTLPTSHIAGSAGALVLLLILTESNDALQYLFGKWLGKTKISPKFSPNKTWEGFLGGMLSTVLLALLLGPLLIDLPAEILLLVGGVIATGGFFGDLVLSAIKRDVGIKDYGTLLPGHGGLLDRLDSLIYTTPIFFHIYYFFSAR